MTFLVALFSVSLLPAQIKSHNRPMVTAVVLFPFTITTLLFDLQQTPQQKPQLNAGVFLCS